MNEGKQKGQRKMTMEREPEEGKQENEGREKRVGGGRLI